MKRERKEKEREREVERQKSQRNWSKDTVMGTCGMGVETQRLRERAEPEFQSTSSLALVAKLLA